MGVFVPLNRLLPPSYCVVCPLYSIYRAYSSSLLGVSSRCAIALALCLWRYAANWFIGFDKAKGFVEDVPVAVVSVRATVLTGLYFDSHNCLTSLCKS